MDISRISILTIDRTSTYYESLPMMVCDYVDIDECAVNHGSCCAEAICRNTEGSYTCTCRPGYAGDGHACRGKSACLQCKACSVNEWTLLYLRTFIN